MSDRTHTRRHFIVAVAGLSFAAIAGTPAYADQGFERWIAAFRATAIRDGVSSHVYDRAFRGITDPDPEVLEKAHDQPEFNDPAWSYFDNRVQEQSVADGKAMAHKWNRWLERIESRFGVDRYILLGIWSMETNYGETLKNGRIMRNVLRSLATLAYGDPHRARFARRQLLAALKIVQAGDIDASHMMGSWAGAMGHTQFIPSSYRLYAVDADGDGKRDIWNSVPDALATAANLLHRNGWQTGQTWGYEVTLPAGRKFPGGSMSLDRWASLGVVRANGKDFPHGGERAVLKVPGGRGGPAFLVLKNFYVLKAYNNADNYVLAVGLLADKIAGYGGLVHDWNRPFTKLSFDQRQELQKRLSARGYYEGKVDGRIGDGSRSAIMAYQDEAGLPRTGNPSLEVLMHLRQR